MTNLPFGFRPLKCPNNFTLTEAHLPKLKFPVYVSPKLDGIRGTTGTSFVQSASGRKLPNLRVHEVLSSLHHGMDGELGVGDPTHPLFYNRTQSAISTIEGEPDFRFYVFDIVPECFKYHGLNWMTPFSERLELMLDLAPQELCPGMISHIRCDTPEEVLQQFTFMTTYGYEGICIRPAAGLYKYGRSTWNEQHLLRMKIEAQSECRILRVNQMELNNNDTTKSPLGFTQRSSHAENQIPYEAVGSFDVQDIHTLAEFTIGIFKGVTLDERERWWKIRDQLPDKVFTYRYHNYGIKDAPRSGRFIGWREAWDMS